MEFTDVFYLIPMFSLQEWKLDDRAMMNQCAVKLLLSWVCVGLLLEQWTHIEASAPMYQYQRFPFRKKQKNVSNTSSLFICTRKYDLNVVVDSRCAKNVTLLSQSITVLFLIVLIP